MFSAFTNFLSSILLVFLVTFTFNQCKLNDLNSSCDTRSSEYLQTLVVLSASGQTQHPCGGGGSLFSQFDEAAINNSLLPEISPSPGRFFFTQSVSISNRNINANICYTMDGTEPRCQESNCENGEQYVSPITINNSTNIKAISCKSGYPSSNLAISTYTYVPQSLYVANIGSSYVSIMKLESNSGSLILSGLIPTASSPTGIAVAKNLGFVYVSTQFNTLNQYRQSANSNMLSSNGTTTSGVSSSDIIVEPLNRFAYVANGVGNFISRYTVNQSDGMLISTGMTGTAGNLYGLITDSEGKFLYASDNAGNLLNIFIINQSNGSLSLTSTVTTGVTPFDPRIHPSGKFLYISNVNGQSVSCYQRDTTNGFLNSRNDVIVDTSPSPRGIAFNKTGEFAYIVGSGTNKVYQAAVDQNSGILTILNSFTTGGSGPENILTEESGNYLYISNYNSNNISVFQINQTNGTLSLLGIYSVGVQPIGIAITGF